MGNKHRLTAGQELRVEVDPETPVSIKLTNGIAEVFGTEMALGETMNITGQKLAVYTWKGCELDVMGEPQCIYESSETPMVVYHNTHLVLNQQRSEAKAAGGQGPRAIVVGPTDAGKSTLSRILINYAVRSGWEPTFVDLDIGQGELVPPGNIAACPIHVPIDVQEGYLAETPLAYYYGHVSPSHNSEHYRCIVECLADTLDKRAERDPQAAASGLIINTMGWIDGLGYDLLLHSIKALKADTVLVVGNEKLYSQLSRHFEGSKRSGDAAAAVAVVKVKQSGGTVTRPPAARQAARIQRVREYFYGFAHELAPHSQTIPLEDLAGRIYRVGGGPKAPSSALPIGQTSVADPLRVVLLAPNKGIDNSLLHCLLAVSRADKPETLLSSNVAGYVYISDVDLIAKKLTYLAPCPGSLPGKYLLAGSFKCYFE